MDWPAHLLNPPKLSWPGQPLYVCSQNWVIPPWNVMCSIRRVSQMGPHRSTRSVKILRQYADVFAKDDLNLGQSSVIKHKIILTEGAILIKEHCRRVPPRLYDEGQKHLQEMIDVWAIWPSDSPWASAVVLVRKKNGKLHFCIDLMKLTSLTVKDTYSTVWFTLLDLENGYWQVELEEASKDLAAFTVGSLRFCECEWMPFGLKNTDDVSAPYRDFLGNLQFHWCIISRWHYCLCIYPKRTFGEALSVGLMATVSWTEVPTC